MFEGRIRQSLKSIEREYARGSGKWYVGFSGGKDSSALLKLIYISLSAARAPARAVTVVYCDTGVEIPIIATHVRRTLRALAIEAARDRLPLRVRMPQPRLDDRYFVKVIGRGYPPPTNKFRWCTDRLRIGPVQRLLNGCEDDAVVLLGLRQGESIERDRAIQRHSSERPGFLRQSRSAKSTIFSPIIDFEVEDVWETLELPVGPKSIDARSLARLYRAASGECPIVREPIGTPCATGRFGCWTCTVVRQDRAMTSMIRNEGFDSLQPLLEFRNWLADMRDFAENRCAVRRNGSPGPGPLTLKARREILRRLKQVELRTGWSLITSRELDRIKHYWAVDRASHFYREM